MRIIVCDDDPIFSNKLVSEINKNIPKYNQLYSTSIKCNCIYPAKDLLEYSKVNHIDILFLDISMPGVDGLSIAEKFHDYYPETIIIFISSYDNFVFYSFRYNPFRFIRKTNMDVELPEALSAAISKLVSKDTYLTIKSQYDCLNIQISRIIYAEKEKGANYINLCCLEGEYRYRNNITELLSTLNDSRFIKINSGTIVNMKYILAIKGDTIVLFNKIQLLIAKKYISEIKNTYLEFMRERKLV